MAMVSVCRCCVDPRESGHWAQHGLLPYNGIYTARRKGATVALAESGISSTGAMLAQLGKPPQHDYIQGHTRCAAVAAGYRAFDKPDAARSATERDFIASHGEVIRLVRALGKGLAEDIQIMVLETLWPLQTVNTVLREIKNHSSENKSGADNQTAFFAFVSQTPDPFPDSAPADSTPEAYAAALLKQVRFAQAIPLKIFSPRQNEFGFSPLGNNAGIRIADLVAAPENAAAFAITAPVPLDTVIANELRHAVAARQGPADGPFVDLPQPRGLRGAARGAA